MSTESHAPPPPPGVLSSNVPPDDQAPAPQHLPEDVLVEHILTRVPAAAAAVRFRAVCRAWRDALTSDHFTEAHRAARAAAAAAHTPEIVFFDARSDATAFYACKLNLTAHKSRNPSSDEAAAPARELVTMENLRASNRCGTDLVFSGTRPCRGLTLLSQLHAYHVCNLSTGEHVSLPPCTPASSYFFGLSSAGLGFDPAAREHKVVRLYHESKMQPRCEVYGLSSGGWRPCAGHLPPSHVAASMWFDFGAGANRGRDAAGRPPVFVDGCFYWHIHPQAAILSLAVSTEEFRWVAPPGRRPVRHVTGLAELDGSLCAMVELDPRLRTRHETELWTRTAGGTGTGGSPPSWSMRCRISFYKLPMAIRNGMCSGRTVLPLASWSGGKILLATSAHEVYAYDPRRCRAERVFSASAFVDYPGEAWGVLPNIALHEDSVTGVRCRAVAGDDDEDRGRLKVKVGSRTLARREGYAADHSIISERRLREMIDSAMNYSLRPVKNAILTF